MSKSQDESEGPHARHLGRKEILNEIRRLPFPQRACAELYFEHGKSIREIAGQLNLDIPAVVDHLKRARFTVRSRLKVECPTQ